MNNKPLAALLAAMMLATIATAAPPDVRNDFGDASFGLEPDPPAVRPPNPELDEEMIGSVLEVIHENVAPGDEFVYNIPGSIIKIEVPSTALDPTSEAGLILRVLNDARTLELQLPPLDLDNGAVADDVDPTVPELDFSVFLTAVTVVVDRAGIDPGTPDRPGDFEADNVIDATGNVWGLVNNFGSIAEPAPDAVAPTTPDVRPGPTVEVNPNGVTKPDTATVTALRHKVLAEVTDKVADLVVIDPEDAVKVGDVDTLMAGTILTDNVHSTAATIEGALGPLTEDGVSVDGVLAALDQVGTDPVGVVDLSAFSLTLEDLAWQLRVIDTVEGTNPATIVDPDTKTLALVDGGFGDVTLLGDQEKFVFDNDLVTALKDPDSIKKTVFMIGDANGLGQIEFDAELGNYAQHITKVQELAKRGQDVRISKDPLECAGISNSESSFCLNPDVNVVTPPAVASLIANPLPDVSSPDIPVGSTFPGVDATGLVKKGAITGELDWFTPNINAFEGVSFAFNMVELASSRVGDFQLGDWTVPSDGLASVEGVNSLDSGAPDIGQLGLSEAPTLPYMPNVLDGIFEGFSAPAMPGINTLVPTDFLTQSTTMVTGASGGVFGTIPLNVLENLPLGATSELVIRAVGGSGSVFSASGIPDVVVQVTTRDPFGLSESVMTEKTNPNGYATFAAPALGAFNVKLSHDDYANTQGAGQTGAPGSKSGHEYTMDAASDSESADFVTNNSMLLLIALAAGLVLFWAVKTGRVKMPRRR